MPSGQRPNTILDILCRIVLREDGCWDWPMSKSSIGYGQVSLMDKIHRVHRLVYETLRGNIPGDLVCDHLCRNRWCCNPDHIDIVTAGENVRRGILCNPHLREGVCFAQ